MVEMYLVHTGGCPVPILSGTGQPVFVHDIAGLPEVHGGKSERERIVQIRKYNLTGLEQAPTEDRLPAGTCLLRDRMPLDRHAGNMHLSLKTVAPDLVRVK